MGVYCDEVVYRVYLESLKEFAELIGAGIIFLRCRPIALMAGWVFDGNFDYRYGVRDGSGST